MSLTGVTFVFFFLPLSIIIYHLIPDRFRNFLLLVLSVVFIAWGSAANLILIAISIVFNYFTALEIDGMRNLRKTAIKRLALASGIAANVALLLFFKYFVFFMNTAGKNAGFSLHLTVPPAPIGISFFTFSAISCLCDISNGSETVLKNPVDFALYISFFGKITSGPIVKFSDMARQIRNRNLTIQSLESGVRLFIIGLSKKLIIAGCLGKLFSGIKAEELYSMSAATAWLGALFYSLMLYYDFSGYSDMAIGLGKIFGFDFRKNFDYPYLAVSMTDFWRKWHISLGAWFRDYVYIPLGGSRVSRSRNIFNLSVVWLLTGLWHGANWTFVVWGIYHLALLLIEKFLLKDAIVKIPAIFRRITTFLLAVTGWTVFFSDNISYAGQYLLRMAGIGGGGLADSTAMFYLSGGGILLAIAILGATPLLSWIGGRISKTNDIFADICGALFFALLLAGSTAFMISDTVMSFLYAQF